MMEQIIMVLVFALASALCLQTFVLAGKISKQTEAENRAVMEAQNAAETIKSQGLAAYIEKQEAEPTKDGFRVSFDAGWNVVHEENQAEYYLELCIYNPDNEYLWCADIFVTTKDGTELFGIPVAGQTEVTRYE